ncbi:hypothetical protein R1sor_013472 [Riccia sorocarpa]|uniref:Uncharacterized protein n=1 Tax=Riccia sorocarpa TaxID=122646 RepID=A0ABD3H6S4_9MARC
MASNSLLCRRLCGALLLVLLLVCHLEMAVCEDTKARDSTAVALPDDESSSTLAANRQIGVVKTVARRGTGSGRGGSGTVARAKPRLSNFDVLKDFERV